MIFFSFFTKEAKEMIYLYYNSRKKGKKRIRNRNGTQGFTSVRSILPKV